MRAAECRVAEGARFLKGLSFGRKWGGAVAVACVVAVSGPVRAQDAAPGQWRTPRIEFQTVPGCPDLGIFRHELALFNSDKFDEDPEAPNVVYVTFAKRGRVYSGTSKIVLTSGPWAAETVTAVDCMSADFVRTVAFNAARGLPPLPPAKEASPPEEPPSDLATRPELPAPEEPPEPERVPSVAWRLVPPPPQPAVPSKVVARSFNLCGGSQMNLSIGLSGLVLMTAGFSDNVGPGFGLGVECRGMPPAWGGFGLSLGLEFRGALPAKATAREPVDTTLKTYPFEIEISTWTGLAVPCLHFAKYFSACAVGQLGAIVMRYDLGGGSNWTAAAGPRLGFEIPFAERFAVFGLGEALFHPERASFKFTTPIEDPNAPSDNVRWREPVVSGFIGAGVAVKFE